ncbi:AAA family ATPase [Sulfurimonas sp.]
MELVYLWVEDYKNIHQQGFNFSPRFKCEYDEESNELTVEENKAYVSIFPDNVNVTAIVGENGSGKSSLLEILMLLFFESKNFDIEKRIWLIFYNKTNNILDIKYFQNNNIVFDNIKISNRKTAKNSINESDDKKYFHSRSFQNNANFYNIYYNTSLDLISSEFLEYCSNNIRTNSASMYDLDFKPQNRLNLFAFPSKKNKIIDIRKNENTIILNMYKSMKVLEQKNVDLKKLLIGLDSEKINFIPKKINFSFLLEDAEYQIKREDFKDIVFEKYNDLKIDSLYAYLISSILSISQVNYQNQELTTYFFEDEDIQVYLQNKFNFIKNEIPENDIVDPIFKLVKYILDNLEEFKNILESKESSLSELISNQGKSLNIAVYDIACLIDVLNGIEDKNILNKPLLNNKEYILKLLPVLPSFIGLDAIDKHNVHFSDFSSGEKNLINIIYSSIYYTLLFSNNNNYINFFIDEMEIGLNPKWQKDIFNIMLKLFTNLHININIFITSHSPFILSDLPKENVIFLEKGKQVDVDIETFGANIHTLLSHGFFMKDGLMGEFAKEQINDAIIKLNQTKLSEDDIKFCENIIKITGEPIIKRQMQKMLDSKRLTKIDELEAEIELMKHRIEFIRKNQ